MMLKIGDKVQIIPKERIFYRGMYNLTSTIGTINRTGENCTYVIFKNKIVSLVIYSKDLELVKVKGRQLEFAFMQTSEV